MATPDRFPAASLEADGEVGGIPTHVSSVAFSDQVVVTISQDGRLAQWVGLAFFLAPCVSVLLR